MSPTDCPIADKVGGHAMHSVAILPGGGSAMQRACSSPPKTAGAGESYRSLVDSRGRYSR